MGKFSPTQLLKKGARLSYHDMILEEAGLVSYWNFGAGQGNKAWDQKGTNHGTISGATWVQKANGIWTLDFDGVNDEINAGAHNSLNDIFDGGGTFTAWINPNSDGGNNAGRVVSKGGATTSLFVSNESGGACNMGIFKDFDGATNGRWDTSNREVIIGEWNALAIVYNNDDSSNNPIIYLNGIPTEITESQTPVGVRVSDAGNDVELGNAIEQERAFDGLINEVAIYNVALTPATILKHYQVGVWGGLAEA